MSEPKVVYTPPPSKYVVQVKTPFTDWENDRGYQSLHEAAEFADYYTRLFPTAQVRVIEVGA